MKITLNDLKNWDACKSGYKAIKKALDDDFGYDTPIPLETGLRVSVPDTIWALSHDHNKYRFQSLMIEIVEPVGAINGDTAVSNCVQALKDHRDGNITLARLLRAAHAALAAAHAALAAAYAAYAAAHAASAAYAARAAAHAATYAIHAVGSDEYIKDLIRKYYKTPKVPGRDAD